LHYNSCKATAQNHKLNKISTDLITQHDTLINFSCREFTVKIDSIRGNPRAFQKRKTRAKLTALIGGGGLFMKLLVPSFHRNVPQIVSDVLRLKEFNITEKDPIQKLIDNKNNKKKKREITLPCAAL